MRALDSLCARIHRWHWGKLVILWSWGSVIVALLIAQFLATPAREQPGVASMTFLGSLFILAALSTVTWVWLGGKESGGQKPEQHQ
jgi:hypothetical protein